MINVLQVLPTIISGDGVSQNAIEIDSLLREAGFNTRIYADNIYFSCLRRNIFSFEKFPKTSKADIIIYHLSIGSTITDQLMNAEGKLIICYHNITPSHWFAEYDKVMEAQCEAGRQDMLVLVKKAAFCLADSEFNAKELQEIKCKCPVKVLPILINFGKFDRIQNRRDFCDQNNHKILFTGRIVPNKKIEDIIRLFSVFQKLYEREAELYLVGSYENDSKYYRKLIKYIDMLEVKNIKFFGHVSDHQLNMLYSQANIYLSLSEHEGFCIPLLEAMHFCIPVLAYDSGAVSETMRGAGVLLNTKEPLIVAGIIGRIFRDSRLRKKIIDEQLIRLEEFKKINKKEILLQAIKSVLEG